MNDVHGETPHFLRVVRALLGVRGAVLPLSAVTTIVAGVYCGCVEGSVPIPPSPPHCTMNSDCVDGLICFKTVCFGYSGNGCAKGSGFPCDTGEVCDMGAALCLAGGESCQSNLDCGTYVCDPAVGICVEDDGPCASDADCSAGETCDPSQATCGPPRTTRGTGGGPGTGGDGGA